MGDLDYPVVLLHAIDQPSLVKYGEVYRRINQVCSNLGLRCFVPLDHGVTDDNFESLMRRVLIRSRLLITFVRSPPTLECTMGVAEAEHSGLPYVVVGEGVQGLPAESFSRLPRAAINSSDLGYMEERLASVLNKIFIK